MALVPESMMSFVANWSKLEDDLAAASHAFGRSGNLGF